MEVAQPLQVDVLLHGVSWHLEPSSWIRVGIRIVSCLKVAKSELRQYVPFLSSMEAFVDMANNLKALGLPCVPAPAADVGQLLLYAASMRATAHVMSLPS